MHSSMEKYLITGAAGFIGSRFVQSCNDQGIPLISVDHEKFFHSREDHRGIDFGQVIDVEALVNWLSREKPRLKAIVHLGAITDTRESDLEKLNHFNFYYSQNLWNIASE